MQHNYFCSDYISTCISLNTEIIVKNIQWHARSHRINIYKQKIMGLTAVLLQLLKKKKNINKKKSSSIDETR